mgnify:CR=1 FL=1
MRVLDLFAGIGGFSLGLHRAGGFETAAFVEWDDYAQKVLAKNFPGVPIFGDIKKVGKDETDGLGRIDCVTGGFPCQPFSVAGKQDGTKDDRHLWPEIPRIIRATNPTWCIFENVRGLLTIDGGMVINEVLSDLEDLGFECQTFVVPACATDAPHRRDRVWIVGHAKHDGSYGTYTDTRRTQSQQPGLCEVGQPERASGTCDVAHAKGVFSDGAEHHGGDHQTKRLSGEPRGSGGADDVPNTNSQRQQGQGLHGRSVDQTKDKDRQADRPNDSGEGNPSIWLPEPGVGRVAHGIPKRVDRLKCLGNAIVPQVATQIGLAILDAEQWGEE